MQHFSKQDVFYSFFGALFVGFVFLSKAFIIDIARSLKSINVVVIILLTILFVTLQIYFVGYIKVVDKKNRPFYEFWAKRFLTVYISSIFVSFLLIYVYGIDKMLGNFSNIFKAAVAFSLPCSLGATLSDLVKKIKF